MLVFGGLSLENIPVNSGMMIFRDLTIKGYWLSSWLASLSKQERGDLTQKMLKRRNRMSVV